MDFEVLGKTMMQMSHYNPGHVFMCVFMLPGYSSDGWKASHVAVFQRCARLCVFAEAPVAKSGPGYSGAPRIQRQEQVIHLSPKKGSQVSLSMTSHPTTTTTTTNVIINGAINDATRHFVDQRAGSAGFFQGISVPSLRRVPSFKRIMSSSLRSDYRRRRKCMQT